MTKRALIVDDDPVSLSIAADLLEAQAWKAFRALNVREALVYASIASPFDLIIIDDHLPDGDFDDISCAFSEEAFFARVSSSEKPEPVEGPWNLFIVKPWTTSLVEQLLNAVNHPASEQILLDPMFSTATLFDRDACRKAFAKHPSLWFRVREGVARRLPELLHEIRASSETRDRSRFQHLAHEISGMLKMLRSQSLAERAQRLESMAESAHWETLSAELGQLNESLPQLESQLEAFGREFAS